MSDELEIIKKQLPEMAGILNAVPGERFELKCAQTLLIVQRRMEESELQTQLAIYNHLFSKEGTASITDLSNVAVAYVKIKTLCEAGNSNFDQISIRELIKEFHAQETKVEDAETPEKKEEIMKELEALEQGRNQNSELLAESKGKMEKNNVLDFADYLKQAKDTEFLDNPDLAMLQAQTCGVVREFMPEDCMYPIRDKGLVPESNELYYSQKTGDDTLLTVKRSFETDEKGLVYSVYEVSDPVTGAKLEPISDRGVTMALWNEKLTGILRDAGMMRDEPMTVMRSEDNLHDYILGLDTNFTKAREDGQGISGEAQIVIDQAKKDTEQASVYARSFYSTVTVPAESVMPSEKRILSLEIDDGLVEGISLVGMDSENAKVSIRSDEKYSYIGSDGKEKILTGDEILKALEGKAKGESKDLAATKNKAR